jgi:hypothetical protein
MGQHQTRHPMTEAEWKALCSELVYHLGRYNEVDRYHSAKEILARANAALSGGNLTHEQSEGRTERHPKARAGGEAHAAGQWPPEQAKPRAEAQPWAGQVNGPR